MLLWRLTKVDMDFEFAQIQSIVYWSYVYQMVNIWVEDLGSGAHQVSVTYGQNGKQNFCVIF